MPDLAIIVPSRGRPKQLSEMMASVRENSELDVRFYIGLDDDDDTRYDASAAFQRGDTYVVTGGRRSLSSWTNLLAKEALWSPNNYRYLASLGDDHRPRTPGWDRLLVEAIERLGVPGIAYGDDTIVGQRLPTAWVVSAELVSALGWMMLPTCEHLYVDAAILELGQASHRIVYRNDVVIEHLHPSVHKAEWDDSYRENNSPRRFSEDLTAFEEWKRRNFGSDLYKVLSTG